MLAHNFRLTIKAYVVNVRSIINEVLAKFGPLQNMYYWIDTSDHRSVGSA